MVHRCVIDVSTNGALTEYSLKIREDDSPSMFEWPQAVTADLTFGSVGSADFALKTFHGDDHDDNTTRALTVPSWTDNRGTGAALSKLMSVDVYEVLPFRGTLGAGVLHGSHVAHVRSWSGHPGITTARGMRCEGLQPGQENRGLSPVTEWILLPRALAAGGRTYQDAKRSCGLSNRCLKQRQRKPKDKLKATDPW